ncbi:MAG: PspC domain-containing protein [Candidatus Hodarchaeota archaeon]
MTKYCDKCGEVVNEDDLFCNNCGSQLDRSKTWVGAGKTPQTSEVTTRPEYQPRTSTQPKRFYRSREDRWIAGVCGGLGEYFDIDPILVRLGFIFVTLFYGFGLILYIILAIFVKENPHQRPREYQRRNAQGY